MKKIHLDWTDYKLGALAVWDSTNYMRRVAILK